MTDSSKDTIFSTLSLGISSSKRPDYINRRLERSGYSRIIQNFLLLWVDSDINDSHEIIAQLRRTINTIIIFNDVDQCIEFLTVFNDEKVFIIVTDTLAQNLVPAIHQLSQVHSIYIHRQSLHNDEVWRQGWTKVKTIFTEVPSIFDTLKKAATECDQNSISISFVPANCDGSNQNLDELDQSFMYTQLFKDILLQMKYDEHSIKDFTTYCRDGNYGELNNINRFEQQYRDQTPIWWYTREGFLYSMLNRALRTVEIDTIIKIGFFVHDLHRHIEQLHEEQFNGKEEQPFTVYRGQGLSEIDFEKIRKSIDGLISFNNFLSTSKDRDTSFVFADSILIIPDVIGILFEITVDPSVSSAPFALVNRISAFDFENEILFSMHTVFRIGSIEQIDSKNNRLWNVKLKLTSDTDQQLRTLTELMREEIYPRSSSWHRMGELLIRLGQSERAEQVCNSVLNDTCDNRDEVVLLSMLGIIKCDQSNYTEALAFYQKALEIQLKSVPANHSRVAASYHNIGSVYFKTEKYSQALSFYEKALQIYENLPPSIHHNLAKVYNSIGLVYDALGEYSQALSFHEKVLEIRKKNLSENHPCLATTYNNIGSVYKIMGEYTKAHLFFEKTLQIFKKVLPADHPDMATSYGNVGSIYQDMGEYSKALSFHEKALEIKQRIFPSHHPDLATSYNNSAVLYHNMGEYTKALIYHKKAIDIKEKILPCNYLDLALSFNNIGSVYNQLGEYSQALSFHQKALDIFQKILPENHPDLISSHSNIGLLYKSMGEYAKALTFLEKALEICQSTLPPNHPNLPVVFNNIGFVYNAMGEYPKALSFYQEALIIKQRILPPNHISLAASYNNISTVYSSMNDHFKSISFCEKALAIKEETLSPDHPDLAISYNNIGALYKNIGEYAKALSFLERALQIMEKVLPSNHSNLAVCYNTIGLVYMNMKEYSKAISFYEKALFVSQNSPDSNHRTVAYISNNMGLLHKDLGEYSKAVIYFERAVTIGQCTLPITHPDLQLWKSNLQSVKNQTVN